MAQGFDNPREMIARAAADYHEAHGVEITGDAQEQLVRLLEPARAQELMKSDDLQSVYDGALVVFREADASIQKTRYEEAQAESDQSGVRYEDAAAGGAERLEAYPPLTIDAVAVDSIALPWPWGTG